MAVIAAYADDNTQPAPSVQDYVDAGVTGVDTAAVNAGIDAVVALDADSGHAKALILRAKGLYSLILLI